MPRSPTLGHGVDIGSTLAAGYYREIDGSWASGTARPTSSVGTCRMAPVGRLYRRGSIVSSFERVYQRAIQTMAINYPRRQSPLKQLWAVFDLLSNMYGVDVLASIGAKHWATGLEVREE